MAISISVNRAINIVESDVVNRAISISETDTINRATNVLEKDAVLLNDVLLIGFVPTGFIII